MKSMNGKKIIIESGDLTERKCRHQVKATKAKTKVRMYQTKRLLHSKENRQQNERGNL